MRRIAVLCLVRDNEPWLRYASSAFRALEQEHLSTAFSYFFFENDSADGTANAARDFLRGRTGALFQEHGLPPYANRGVNYERVHRLAWLRNELADRAAPLMQDADWALLIDSDIVFDVPTLSQMFAVRPAAQGYAMVTPFSVEVRISESTGAVTSHGHYYDTYAFVDSEDRCHWPHCVFPGCRQCPPPSSAQELEPALPVRSAFGGFALVDAAALRSPRVRWRALSLPGGFAVCEHVAFCDALFAHTGRGVVVATAARGVRWVRKVV